MQFVALFTFVAFLASSIDARVENVANDQTVPISLVPLFETKAVEYFVSTAKTDQADADWYCRQAGSRLLTIETHAEQDDIIKQLQRYPDVEAVWTAGTDIAKEGTWVWGHKSPIIYDNFAANQIDSPNENCLKVMGHRCDNNYQWVKANCQQTNKFICETNK